MDHQKLAQGLIDLIMAIDPNKISVPALMQSVGPQLGALSELLHVARMEAHVHTEPSVYFPDGAFTRREMVFHPDSGPAEDAYEMRFDKLRGTTSAIVLYPCKGHRWTDEERQVLAVIGRLLYTNISRISMIEFQQKIAFTDQMTGLNNTTGAIRFCERVAAQYSLADYASCFINIKNLKYINRQMDNHAGDYALRQFASGLFRTLDPEREQLARLGGDNFFALVLKNHLEDFVALATAMPLEIKHGEKVHSITLSAWVGIYPATGEEKVRDLMDNASFAYELAKRTKVTVARYNPSMMEASLHARKISQLFPQALAKHEFVPYYQPKVSLHTGELRGCEALVRWIRDGEVIPPAQFLPVAENSDLITALDMYMLDAVCHDIRDWQDAGIEPVRVSINYSQRDFYSETLIQDTLNTVRRYGVNGKYLEIEITETSFFENFDALARFVEVMHENGIRVSLDDFGTGYSSLALFESLNLDVVKLDRSFFTGSQARDTRDKGRLVLHSVAEMLNRLKKTTVSEGVETDDQLHLVDEIGGDIVQGFYFDRPLAHDIFTQRLRERHYDLDAKPRKDP